MADTVKFRWHRGGLEESMATMVEDTPGNIKELIAKEVPGELTSEFYAVDERIDWEKTHIVMVDGNAVGFADSRI